MSIAPVLANASLVFVTPLQHRNYQTWQLEKSVQQQTATSTRTLTMDQQCLTVKSPTGAATAIVLAVDFQRELEDRRSLCVNGIANRLCLNLVSRDSQGKEAPSEMPKDLDVASNNGIAPELAPVAEAAAQVAAAEVEKHRSAFAQAADRDRLTAEALGWRQGLAPAHDRPYYFHPERPAEVLFSVDNLRALIDGRAKTLLEAKREEMFNKLAAEYGPLFADIERCIIVRSACTVEQEYAEARLLSRAAFSAAAAATPETETATSLKEADALTTQASKARDSAASSHAEAKKAAKAGDFAAAVALNDEAVKAEKLASELEKRALQWSAEAVERATEGRVRAEAEVARVAAQRDNFYLPATLEERCAAEVARLQACRDSSIEAGDYEAAGQYNAKANAYASLVPKLQGLAWMQWRSEDREAARVREEVKTLRQKLAGAEATIEAHTKVEATARAEAKARAQEEEEKAKARKLC